MAADGEAEPTTFQGARCRDRGRALGRELRPVALAAVCELTLEEVYPHVGEFVEKPYTNPTLMFAILRSLDVQFEPGMLGCRAREMRLQAWPHYGLARVQWEGPWTKPGVPIKARYRKTHWVGCAYDDETGERGIFDINCMNNGNGWVSLADWERIVVPWILRECVPRADGRWHLTHAVEVDLCDSGETAPSSTTAGGGCPGHAPEKVEILRTTSGLGCLESGR